MQEKLELLLSIKYLYSSENLKFLNEIIVHKGFHGVNLPGIYVADYLDYENRPHIFITLDKPFGFNNHPARVALLNSYMDQFGDCIEGFNIGPLGNPLLSSDWSGVKNDLAELNGLCQQRNKQCRFVFDLAYFEEDEDIRRVCDSAEQSGIKNIICGSSVYDKQIFKNVLDMTERIKSNNSSQIGLFGNFNSPTTLQKVLNNDFAPILILPRNVFKLFDE